MPNIESSRLDGGGVPSCHDLDVCILKALGHALHDIEVSVVQGDLG